MCSHDSGAPGRHVDAVAIDRLAGEITELASHIHAATCRWLGLVAEFDRRGGWAQWGCKTCAHFISWRCAIAPGAAREHVRVARRLVELPIIRAAFSEGRLSYSKVRALSRVEKIAREQELLSLAEHATAAELEQLVRSYRGVLAAERVAAGARPQRYVTWDHADDGSLLLRARLPAEEGAIVLAALQAGLDALDASADAPAQTPDAGADAAAQTPDGIGAVSAETPGGEVDASGEAPGGTGDVSAEAPGGEVDASAEAPGGTGDDSAETPGEGVDASAEAPGGTGDVSAETPGEGVDASAEALDGTGDDSAETPGEGVDASAERPGGEVGVPAEAPRALAERRADALVLMADTLLAAGPDGRDGDRYQVVLHVDTDTLAAGGDGRCELADGQALAPETARRLACDAAIVALSQRDGKPLSVGRKTRSVHPALRRALASRDRGCRFPGCASRCAVDAHHIQHWASGGPTSLDNLVQLCRFHHRLLHEGGYSVEKLSAGFVFRRPDGQRIRAVPRPPRGHARTLHEGRYRNIHPEACVPHWTGERLDLGAAVDAMLAIAPAEPPGI